MSLILALALAHAAPAAHYHPVDVGMASQRFAEAQEVAGKAFEAGQERAQTLAGALLHFEASLDLLGDQAPDTQRARQLALRKEFDRQRAILQDFAQGQLDGFDALFGAALERALAGTQATECRGQAPGLRMGPQRARPEACVGEPINEALAARMDADPQLSSGLRALLDAPWPTLTLDVRPQEAVGTGTATLDVLDWIRGGAGAALQAIEATDADAREAFEAEIEDGASTEQLQALVGEARALTARTAAARAALAGPVLLATEAAAAKLARKGLPTVAWCAQPVALGGCLVPPATPADQATLREAAPVVKAFVRASGSVPAR